MNWLKWIECIPAILRAVVAIKQEIPAVSHQTVGQVLQASMQIAAGTLAEMPVSHAQTAGAIATAISAFIGTTDPTVQPVVPPAA